ncbi:MAG TPA: hypothetical protein VF572_05740 [Candidatus Saccharimonadales bacterium]|jgi:hypothetical protein
MQETKFSDKTGKVICIGDIIQLKTHRKTGGASRMRVIQNGKRVQLVNADSQDDRGFNLSDEHAKIAVIIDRVQ